MRSLRWALFVAASAREPRTYRIKTGLLALAATVLGFAPPSLAIELRLIGVQHLAPRSEFQHTMVGGLSGIDYDPVADRWLAVSDDKSEFSPARFYEVKLDYDAARFTAAEITGVTPLGQPDGSDYPDRPHFIASHRGAVPDFESLRRDPRDGSIWYASEGDRGLGLQPFVRHAMRDGKFLGELPRPAMFTFVPEREIGPRHNLAFEGLAFAPDGATLWLAMEAPLYQDGAPPTTTTGAVTRITQIARDGKILAQFGYLIEPIPVEPAAGKLADNGVSEILALPGGELLALERSGRQDAGGTWHYSARLFAVNFSAATDISNVAALGDAKFTAGAKRRVFDFSAAGRTVDNLEGLAWGRPLANGHATLVAVSDDNFVLYQETQFWIFEVLPESPPIRPL